LEGLSAGIPPYTAREIAAKMKKAINGSPQIFEWLACDKNGRIKNEN
jgi:hypothetical protein